MGKGVGKGLVKPKRPCCQSRPRCKRCSVVLKRLEKAGWAERVGKRYRVAVKPPKKQLKAARGR